MRSRSAVLASAALLLGGCWPFAGFVHDEHLDGPWRLVAVDTMSDMILCRSDDPSFCVGDGLPGPTVFAAGWDDRHVVVAAHEDGFHGGDRPAFYYVVRVRSDPMELASAVRGPFLQADFERERARLGLPEFSRTFDGLR